MKNNIESKRENNMEKLCQKCGNQLDEEDKFCQKCGTSIKESNNTSNDTQNNKVDNNISNNTQTNNNENNSVNTKSSYNLSAVVGFICSLVGFIGFKTILGIVAISLGITAKQHFKVFKNEKGQGFATAAIIIGCIDIILSLIYIMSYIANVS